jgi:hypothetical protein
VTSGWFGFNAIIVANLFELTFQFSQKRFMEKSWAEMADLLVSLTISSPAVDVNIKASDKECQPRFTPNT